MSGRLAILSLLVLMHQPLFSCTCMSTTYPADYGASVVFRGTVTDKKLLPARPEMQRGRYAITFNVDKYWKGSRQRTIVLYGLDDGTDCMGGSYLEVGKNYLVFASEHPAQDNYLDGIGLWYGWTDILPKGTHILMLTACAPSGETSMVFVKAAVKRLGKGSAPTQ